ncbi:hypothetical protein J6A31_05600 [bacterium]|nr:hypothetical protein [bacterium]
MKWNIIGGLADLAGVFVLVFLSQHLPLLAGSIVVLIFLLAWFIFSLYTHSKGDNETLYACHIITTVIAFLVGLVFLIIAGFGIKDYICMEGYSEISQATIIDIVDYDNSSPYLKLECDTGERYTVTLHGSFAGMKGDVVEILHKPDDDGGNAYSSFCSRNNSLWDSVVALKNPIIVEKIET